MIIDRSTARARIRAAFSVHPAIALTGPRQCGKTTLARETTSNAPENTFLPTVLRGCRQHSEAVIALRNSVGYSAGDAVLHRRAR